MGSLRAVLAGLLLVVLLVPAAAVAGEPSPRDQQWGLERVRAPAAWSESRGDGVVVAVVDTGVDLTHPDLAPRLLRDGAGRVVGRNEVDGNGDAQDGHGHGTHVAGVAAAAADAGLQGEGIAGVAPRARIMPVKALDDEGRGSVSDLDAGIRWAVDNGADVINLSLESAVPLPGELVATGPDAAVRYAWERGVAVVAAAGNSGTPFTDYRASTPVLLVGATDRDDRRASFSDAGRSDMVFAPGVDILSSTCKPCGGSSGHGYGRKSGTSFAAPHVAGAAALLRARGANHEEAVERLRTTAVDLEGGGMFSGGHGRIDAAAAVGIDESASSGQRADESAPGADSARESSDASEGDEDRPERDDGGSGTGSSSGQASSSGGDGTGSQADADPEPAPEPDPAEESAPNREAEEGDEPGAETDDGGEAPEPVTSGREAAEAVELPQSRGGLSGVGLLEGLAGALVVGSAAAVAGVRRRFGAF